MTYKIEFEDKGQDIIQLEVDEKTGEITDAGLMSRLYADGKHWVIISDLGMNRKVRFRRDGSDDIEVFRYLMCKLSLNGKTLCEDTAALAE